MNLYKTLISTCIFHRLNMFQWFQFHNLTKTSRLLCLHCRKLFIIFAVEIDLSRFFKDARLLKSYMIDIFRDFSTLHDYSGLHDY